MTGPMEIERKVRQLDNDVQAIYVMLSTIEATQKRQGNRLDEIDTKVNAIADTQNAMAETQAGHGQKLDAQGEKLDAILDLLRGNQSQ